MLHRSAIVNLRTHVSNSPTPPELCRSPCSVGNEPKKKSNTHFDAVLPSGRDHLATVKLKRRHAMVVLDRLENPSSAEIPNLLDYFFRV